MRGCIVWVFREGFFSSCNEEGIHFQPLAVLPDDPVAHGNPTAETQNKGEGRGCQPPALASRQVQRRAEKAPCKKNSDGKAAHQPTRMGGLVGSFREMAKEQFEWHQEDDPEQNAKGLASREIELGKRKQGNQDSGLSKNCARSAGGEMWRVTGPACQRRSSASKKVEGKSRRPAQMPSA